MAEHEKNHNRLSDRILDALELAVEQEDLTVAEMLNNALELTMTRKAGGPGFFERREYPPELEEALNKLRTLKDAS